MASQNSNDTRPGSRLYLVAPPVADTAGIADKIAAALDAGDVAAVLLSLTGPDERALLNGLKALVPMVQGKAAALVLDGRPDLVARAGADGAHLSGIEAFIAALATLKPERIAGCGGLLTRHDAMLAAEGGADYVMFGEPGPGKHRPPFDAIVERVEWWAEVFEIPCVGYAADLGEVGPLAAAGADFIAVGPFIFDDPRGPALAMKQVMDRLTLAEGVE